MIYVVWLFSSFIKNENGHLEFDDHCKELVMIDYFCLNAKILFFVIVPKIYLGYISFIILIRPDKSTFPWRYIVLRMREKSKFLQPLIYFKDCLLVMSFLCVYSTSRIICGQWKFNTDLWSWNFFSSDARIIYRALHRRGCTLCY